MITNTVINDAMNSPTRHIIGKVALLDSSATNLKTFSYKDTLKSVTIERVGETDKFFGFGVCQKINVKILDPNRELDITTSNRLIVALGALENGVENYDYYNLPYEFYVTEVNRDENTNELSITAYDALYKAGSMPIGDEILPLFQDASYKLYELVDECAFTLNLEYFDVVNMDIKPFELEYQVGEANLEGTETIREVLNAVAELTQTIYFIQGNLLLFKRLDKDGAPAFTIDKANYMELDSKTNRRLSNIVSTTQLGDNISANVREHISAETGLTIADATGLVSVRVTSKNLIYYPYYNTTSNINGVDYTVNADGSITANGKPTATAFFYLVQSMYLPAGTYTLSSDNLTSARELRATIMNLDNTVDRYIYNGTFTIDSDKYIYIYLVTLGDGDGVENVTYKPILERGTTATTYTPYYNAVSVAINGVNYMPVEDGYIEVKEIPFQTSMGFIAHEGIIIDVVYYKPNTMTGTTQYIRDNPFLELREDIVALIDEAQAVVRGFMLNQFYCNWRGNILLEIGDKIALVNKDNSVAISYILDDVIEYNGGLTQKTQWSYEDSEAETANNPATLGDMIKYTYAKVDKVNKEIEIVASETESNKGRISSLQVNTNNISSSVADLNNKVSAMMTSEDVKLEIQNEIANGVERVTTTTGFLFNEDGLTVSKAGTEMTTQITEDGMAVFRDETEVLTADNTGVKAENLQATTYLIIGNNSRFEDYGGSRTGCFWIG